MLNETHSPDLRSWIESANVPGIDFPIQNLPHGIFRRRSSAEAFRGGVAIGDQILDLAAALRAGAFSGTVAAAAEMAAAPTLNGLMAMGPSAWSTLRLAISRLLREGAPQIGALRDCLVPQADADVRRAGSQEPRRCGHRVGHGAIVHDHRVDVRALRQEVVVADREHLALLVAARPGGWHGAHGVAGGARCVAGENVAVLIGTEALRSQIL